MTILQQMSENSGNNQHNFFMEFRQEKSRQREQERKTAEYILKALNDIEFNFTSKENDEIGKSITKAIQKQFNNRSII
ncbi:MAG: hypothetical protein NC200_04455 [Candidatus Gastranaerophilales bacterium]|nr:hypothetical protein [Candidatus Gastranaerophilales bacterium]